MVNRPAELSLQQYQYVQVLIDDPPAGVVVHTQPAVSRTSLLLDDSK